MLVPAILYKEQIATEFFKRYYTDEMMYYQGWLGSDYAEPTSTPGENNIQYAIVDSDKNLLGYFCYYRDWYSNVVNRFGLFSFSKGNLTIGRDVYAEVSKLLSEVHRFEFRMLGGNPVERHYDKFCATHNGNKYILKDAMRDRHGIYHDDVIYEIINPDL